MAGVEEPLIPAAGLEVYLQTEFGSPALRSGLQPSMSLLFDHTLPFGINFEWNVGVNGAQKPLHLEARPPQRTDQPLPRARSRRPWNSTLSGHSSAGSSSKLDIFIHGFINGSAIPNLADGVEIGGGAIYTVNERISVFGSYNAGVTIDAATTFFLLGFAYAL